MTCRVIVCDDEPTTAQEWIAEITGALPDGTYDLAPVPTNETIKEAIQVLLRRRSALNDGSGNPNEECLFDAADVLVIDYDLLHIDETNTRYTGEGVARLARAFSKCGLIVVLNQYLEAQFDLGLRGHTESFADLNLDGDLIGRQGLWRDGPWEDFRPWSWPVLSDAAARFRSREQFLSDPANLSTSITGLIGMTEADAGRLSDTAFGFLAPEAATYEALASMTFAHFIEGASPAIDTRDGTPLAERYPAACARIASSRVAKWLEREVLGPQDVLIDVPHLLQRCPFLLEGDLNDIEAWNRAVTDGRAVLKNLVPEDAWFTAEHWLGQPALWWRRVEAADAVRACRAKFDFSTVPDFVFLEDVSRFDTLANATEFRAGFHNAHDRRYVAQLSDIRYAPQRRLAFGG